MREREGRSDGGTEGRRDGGVEGRERRKVVGQMDRGDFALVKHVHVSLPAPRKFIAPRKSVRNGQAVTADTTRTSASLAPTQ